MSSVDFGRAVRHLVPVFDAPPPLPPAIICEAPRAIDGDTLSCRNLPRNARLAGIDAPELPGHCRRGRACTRGNGLRSKRVLASLLRSGPVHLELRGNGGYGRYRAIAWVGTVNINCAMLASGAAVRRYGSLSC